MNALTAALQPGMEASWGVQTTSTFIDLSGGHWNEHIKAVDGCALQAVALSQVGANISSNEDASMCK